MEHEPRLEDLCRAAIAGGDDEPAVEFERHWHSRGELNALARRILGLLDATGAGRNPVVAFAARNRPATLAAFLAVLARACSVRMVYPFQSAEALAAELQGIAPAVTILSEEDATEPVRAALKSGGSALVVLSRIDAALAPDLALSAATTDRPGEAQVVLLTSGTTGKPKPFALEYATVARYYSGDSRARSNAAPARGEAALLYFPFGNISGLYTTLPALLGGQPIVLLDRFSLDAWLDFVRRFRPVHFGMPSAAYRSFLELNVPPEELSSIKAMGSGAAPLDPEVKEAFEARYGIPVLMSYGATEFGGPVTRMTPQMHAEIGATRRGTVGKAMEGMRIRIVDALSGAELAAGEEGLVEVVSCRIGPDWIRTADLGVMDGDGYLYLRGRADGAIMRGGFKLLPAVIEAGLLQNDAVSMAVVVGVADARLGQVPGAMIALKQGAVASADSLAADLRGRLPATHIPVHWRIVESLPKTPSFKIDLAAIKAAF